MVIDINKLARQGKSVQDFYFDFPVDKQLVLSPDIVLERGEIQGEIILEDKVYVQGKITFKISGSCSRCLEDAKQDIQVDVEEVFSQRPQDDEYRYKSGMVDLTEMVKDKILSNQPAILLCDINCKGLCPKCGCNLNTSSCNCEK